MNSSEPFPSSGELKPTLGFRRLFTGAQPRRAALRMAVVLIYIFLLAAPVIVICYSLSPGVVMQFPPEGATLRWYQNLLDRPRLLNGIWYSGLIASLATLAALAIGVPAALALTRGRLPGRAVLAAFFLSPLNLPGLVLAIGILMFLVAVVQPLLAVSVVAGTGPLFIAHLLITVPWVIRTVAASLEASDPSMEDAARGLGATPVQTFFLVTLFSIRPGVIAGAIFAFIVSFGNFSLSLFFTSGEVTTLPVAIFEYIDRFQDPTVAAVSSVVILATTAMVLVAERFGALTRTLASRQARQR
ncbi:MAG: ABC transporter permease [Acidobacteriota bacterium]